VAVLDPDWTYTRADFLFAYWLARAAGVCVPGPSEPQAGTPPPSFVPPPPPPPSPEPDIPDLR
jgi:hypothetical protein